MKLSNGKLIEETAEDIANKEKAKSDGAKVIEKMKADKKALDDLKASAKAKLIAGEAMTEEEDNVLVGV